MVNDPASDPPGAVERSVAADLAALITAHPMAEGLRAMSLQLARRLDGDLEDKSVAGVNRELRANLVELAKFAADAEDDLEADLSTPSEE